MVQELTENFHRLIDRPRTLNEFLAIAKIYIRYEKKLYADSLNKSKKGEPAYESSRKPFNERKKVGKVTREGKAPNGRCTEYRPLAMSKEKILAEITKAYLTEAYVKPPKARRKRGKGSTKQNIVGSTSATGTLLTIAST